MTTTHNKSLFAYPAPARLHGPSYIFTFFIFMKIMKGPVKVKFKFVVQVQDLFSCAGADRLQTGMRGAFGKPEGVCARVKIGQVLLSVRTKEHNRVNAVEALRRSKFKFPGRQKIVLSNRWGFTKYTHEQYAEMKANGLLESDGNQVKHCRQHGPLPVPRGMKA